MNIQSTTASNPLADRPDAVQAMVPAVSPASTVPDRLYQIAALTAGIFLLATLL